MNATTTAAAPNRTAPSSSFRVFRVFRGSLLVLAMLALAGCATTAGVNWSSDGGASGFFGTSIQKTFGR